MKEMNENEFKKWFKSKKVDRNKWNAPIQVTVIKNKE